MLGLWLVEQEIISEAALDNALNIQMQSGGRLGDILIAEGATTPYLLYQALAAEFKLPFVDLLKEEWDTSLLDEGAMHEYIRLRFLPIGQTEHALMIATSEPDSRELMRYLAASDARQITFFVTSPLDIRRTIEQYFTEALTEHSQHRLAKLAPEHSALFTLSPSQKIILWALAACVLSLSMIAPYHTAAITLLVANLLYVLALSFKALVFLFGLRKSPFLPPAMPMTESDLPSYTLLVPLFHEARNVAGLLASLGALDYPKHKLDIKLVLEADDQETIAAALACKPSYQFDIIRVPVSNLRTKPKACNYALAFARGDIITIYDAEDRPEPRQLQIAAECFDTLPGAVTCIQAKLRYDNAHENWLTRFFDIEYAVLFEHLLPGLERLSMPIPLGGTSNHVNAERLREIGEWDPYNVTEDADLGVRLAALGYKTRTIPSTTYEEAPISFRAWMRQRSRWMKGHMQTWLVYMRQPIRLYKSLGFSGFVGFHMFLGLPYFLFLTAPYVFVLSMLWQFGYFQDVLPAHLTQLMWCNLLAFFALHWLQAFYVCHTMKRPGCPSPCRGEVRRGALLQSPIDAPTSTLPLWTKETLAAFFFPAYWLLHIATSFISLHQLIRRPHHWMKTTHGVSRMRTNSSVG